MLCKVVFRCQEIADKPRHRHRHTGIGSTNMASARATVYVCIVSAEEQALESSSAREREQQHARSAAWIDIAGSWQGDFELVLLASMRRSARHVDATVDRFASRLFTESVTRTWSRCRDNVP